MKSAVIKGQENQLTLSFEQGISERFQSLRECIATGDLANGKRVKAYTLAGRVEEPEAVCS